LSKVSLCLAVVILVPTRELALQTSQVCKELGKHLKIQVMVTTGGTSLKDDIVRLYQPVHLLVGTPGRILDLTKKGVCILNDCSMLIMDEVIYFKLYLSAFILLPHVNDHFYHHCAAFCSVMYLATCL
jgi:superfamily II DNA/RNA helicase